jgi:hypothetical protein
MTYQLEITVEKDYLKGRVSGQQTLTDNEKLVTDLASACIEHKVNKILLDMTGLVGQPGTLSDFQLANFAVEKGLLVFRKVALISAPENYEFTTFFEAAAQNRGLNVIAFLDEEEALAWINQA